MANYNLTSQQIKDTYEQLIQGSGSIEGGVSGAAVVDGTGSRITTLHVTASQATSASHAIQADSASYAPNTGVTSIIAGTNITVDQSTGNVTINSSGGGGSVDTGSLLVTASNVDATITYTKGDGSTFQNIINNVANATEAEDLVITVKNTSGGTLAKGTAVHAVSVTGENVDVIAASNDSASAMPAIGLLSAELTNNSAGTCIIAGRDTGLNTSGLVAGASVYVSTGGALTSTKPTGSALIQNIGTAAKINASDGEIIIQGAGRTNDLPNVTEGAVWVGNSNQVPTAVQTGSLSVATASMAEDLVSTANISINSITASNASFESASIGYLQTVTGSATIIGSQYVVLNADSPTARFAGIKVYDSGSGLTGSFEWDSVDDNWVQVETGGSSAGMLTGASGSKGSETYPSANTILKGTGNHTVVDSSITDDGTNVTMGDVIADKLEMNGSGVGNGNGAITLGTATNGLQYPQTYLYSNEDTYPNNIFAGHILKDLGTGGGGSGGNTEATYELSSYNPNAVGETALGMQYNSNHVWWISPNHDYFNVEKQLKAKAGAQITGSFDTTSTITSKGGSIQALGGGGMSVGNSGYALQYPAMNVYTNSGSYGGQIYGSHRITDLSGNNDVGILALSTFNSGDPGRICFETQFNSDVVWWISENKNNFHIEKQLNALAGAQITGSLNVTGSTDINGTLAITGIANVSASIAAAGGGGAAFPYVGAAEITGSLNLSGSAINNIATPSLAGDGGGFNFTASIDFDQSNMFNLPLDNGTTYHFSAVNINPGQTATLRVPQGTDGNGQIEWSPAFKFPSGVAPTATTGIGAEDIYTFVMYDTGSVYTVQTADLS